MRRREFVAGLAGTAAIGFDARAQSSARIGHIDNGPPETRHEALLALRRGLSETGYVEGQNLIVDYAWAAHEEDFTRLAADLVARRVAAIVAPGVPQALALKAATRTIPVIFTSAVDPIEAGLVTTLNRPEGNLTGFSGLISLVSSKRLEILRRVVPGATIIAHLADPNNEALTRPETSELQSAAQALGVRLLILYAHEPSHVIRSIALDTGIITTVVGTGQRGDGPEPNPLQCALSRPHGIFIDRDGTLYVSDSEAHRIRVLI